MADLDSILETASSDDVVIDFSEAVDFDLLPDGDYSALIESAEQGKSKEGNPKIVWKFVIQSGPETAGKVAGRILFRHTPITGKGAGLAKQVIKAIGGNVDGDRIQFKLSSAKGKGVVLVVGKQKDDPNFNEIKRVKPAAVGASALGL